MIESGTLEGEGKALAEFRFEFAQGLLMVGNLPQDSLMVSEPVGEKDNQVVKDKTSKQIVANTINL